MVSLGEGDFLAWLDVINSINLNYGHITFSWNHFWKGFVWNIYFLGKWNLMTFWIFLKENILGIFGMGILFLIFFLKTGDPLSILGRYFESLTSFWKWYFIEVISHMFFMEKYFLRKWNLMCFIKSFPRSNFQSLLEKKDF